MSRLRSSYDRLLVDYEALCCLLLGTENWNYDLLELSYKKGVPRRDDAKTVREDRLR